MVRTQGKFRVRVRIRVRVGRAAKKVEVVELLESFP